jgi:hypothetical protein
MMIAGGLAGLAGASRRWASTTNLPRSLPAPSASTASPWRCWGRPTRSAWCFRPFAGRAGRWRLADAVRSGVSADIIQIIQALVLAFVAAPTDHPPDLSHPQAERPDRIHRLQQRVGEVAHDGQPTNAHHSPMSSAGFLACWRFSGDGAAGQHHALGENTWLRVFFGVSALNFTLRASVPLILGALSASCANAPASSTSASKA